MCEAIKTTSHCWPPPTPRPPLGRPAAVQPKSRPPRSRHLPVPRPPNPPSGCGQHQCMPWRCPHGSTREFIAETSSFVSPKRRLTPLTARQVHYFKPSRVLLNPYMLPAPDYPERLLSLILVPLLCLTQACATSASASRVETPYVAPLAAVADQRLPALSRWQAKRASNPQPARGPSHARPTSRRTIVEAPTVSPPTFPEVTGDLDLLRAEVVRSARRLLGIRNSFDDRSFIGHILYVNDLLPRGSSPESFETTTLLRVAEKNGRLIKPSSAMAGDLVVFPCESGCGPAAPNGIATGVLVRVSQDRLDFITYIDSKVQTCHYGERPPRHPSRRVGEIRAVISLTPPSKAGATEALQR